jgi:argininosuccinate lyase
MEVRDEILKEEKYKYIFTVEAMNDLVNQGVSYRDAYREIGNQVDAGTFSYDYKNLQHTHEGSVGNLCLAEIRQEMAIMLQRILP